MRNENGSVVAETVMVLPTLLIITTMLLAGLAAVDSKFKCEQLASSVARAIERGEPKWDAMLHQAMPEAEVDVVTRDEWTYVTVTKKVSLGFSVSGRAVALQRS